MEILKVSKITDAIAREMSGSRSLLSAIPHLHIFLNISQFFPSLDLRPFFNKTWVYFMKEVVCSKGIWSSSDLSLNPISLC